MIFSCHSSEEQRAQLLHTITPGYIQYWNTWWEPCPICGSSRSAYCYFFLVWMPSHTYSSIVPVTLLSAASLCKGFHNLQFVNRLLKVTLNSCCSTHSQHAMNIIIIVLLAMVMASVDQSCFGAPKFDEQRPQASYFFMLGKLYDHWWRAWDYKPAWNAVCL